MCINACGNSKGAATSMVQVCDQKHQLRCVIRNSSSGEGSETPAQVRVQTHQLRHHKAPPSERNKNATSPCCPAADCRAGLSHISPEITILCRATHPFNVLCWRLRGLRFQTPSHPKHNTEFSIYIFSLKFSSLLVYNPLCTFHFNMILLNSHLEGFYQQMVPAQ